MERLTFRRGGHHDLVCAAGGTGRRSIGLSRPAGAANGANPVAVVLPCHRIIGSNGSLTGYGGGYSYLQALAARSLKA